MKTKILTMAVIEKDDAILMRKKPHGSKPYTETRYIFGTEVEEGVEPTRTLFNYLKEKINIEVSVDKHLGRTSEIKKDLDGEVKQFIYLDCMCTYISGKIYVPLEVEKIERIPKDKLSSYDIVPPSVELFKKLGYL